MKTAIYVRVSTNLQASEGTSLENQVEICQNKAQSMGMFNFEIYQEKGASGEDIERPEMDRLRQDVMDGKIAHIVCTHPDRLSRNLIDKLIVCKEFEKRNVELVFCDTEYKDTPEGQLFFNMQSVIAQYELSMIRKRTSRGRLKAVSKQQKIMPMRVAPYGYDLINAQLVINEAEAKYVKMIYEWYVRDKLTLRQIGNQLVEQGAIPKRKESNYWNQTSIDRILSSEVYVGIYWYNRRESKKINGQKTKNGNQKKTYTFRDKSEWIYTEVPAIIDKGLFQLAKHQRIKNKTHKGSQKFQYLLKGLLSCGHCGRTWGGTTYSGRVNKETGEKTKYRCYRCPNKNPRKFGKGIEKCPTKTLRAEIMEDYIWKLIIKTIVKKDVVINYLENEKANEDEQMQNTLVALKRRIGIKEKAREKVKKMYMYEQITEEEMDHDLSNLNQEIRNFKTDLEAIENHFKQSLSNKLSKNYAVNVLSSLEDLIQGGVEVPFDKKRSIIQTLIDEIVLTFKDDNTRCEVTCIGHLDVLIGQNDIALNSQHQEI